MMKDQEDQRAILTTLLPQYCASSFNVNLTSGRPWVFHPDKGTIKLASPQYLAPPMPVSGPSGAGMILRIRTVADRVSGATSNNL